MLFCGGKDDSEADESRRLELNHIVVFGGFGVVR